MKKNTIIITIILTLLLGACSNLAPDTTAEPTEVIITEEPEVEEVEATPEEVEIKLTNLSNTSWAWVSFTNPMEQVDIEDPLSYTLELLEDGTFSAVADCNLASGTFTVEDNRITFDTGPMTVALCSNDSLSEDYLKYLESTANYFFEGESLFIDLIADGGTLVFLPSDHVVAEEETGFPEELSEQLDTFLESQVYSEGGNPKGAAPGLVLLVDTPQGQYLNAAGVSSLEDGTPMHVDDILEIGSNSKSFTVVILMQLQEEGVLALNDLLSDWLPDLAAEIPNGDVITLYQLANHTSGIWDYGDAIIGEAAENPENLEQDYSPEALVQYALDNGTPDFAPGEGWKYSNTGYILMGMIAEEATGQSLSELYQERIFEPLGLDSATLISGVPQKGELTTQGYWWKEDGSRLNTTNWNVSQGWAAGGISMTAEDLLSYGKALSAGELFQDPTSLDQMLTFNSNSLFSVGAAYGLGLIDLGNGYWGHEGQTAGFQTLWYTNPENQITVVGLTNSAAYSAYSFLNVRNVLNGIGLKPFTSITLLPIADKFSSIAASKWEWKTKEDGSGTMNIDPGTEIALNSDGAAVINGSGCGTATGTFSTTPNYDITFDLDDTAMTCTGDEPIVELLGFLNSIQSWRFENGFLAFALEDGTLLRFGIAKSE